MKKSKSTNKKTDSPTKNTVIKAYQRVNKKTHKHRNLREFYSNKKNKDSNKNKVMKMVVKKEVKAKKRQEEM